MFLAGYAHFLRAAEALQWDERDIDLALDRDAWSTVPEGLTQRLTALVAGFCIAEARVADELAPFCAAAASEDAAACFRAQRRDEERHARFFDRVAREVLNVPGATASARQSVLRRQLTPKFVELFDSRLPAAASQLAAGEEDLDAAVGLYHMLLEGVVFTAAQHAMLELLQGDRLPGLRTGVEAVLRDERWHVGFGARVLNDIGANDATILELLNEADAAVEAWGDSVPSHHRDRALELHRRRLTAAGLVGPVSNRANVAVAGEAGGA